MTERVLINKRTPKKAFPYIAGFKGVKVELYASGMLDAKQTAVEHFRPSKKDAGLVWVESAQEDDDNAAP